MGISKPLCNKTRHTPTQLGNLGTKRSASSSADALNSRLRVQDSRVRAWSLGSRPGQSLLLGFELRGVGVGGSGLRLG